MTNNKMGDRCVNSKSPERFEDITSQAILPCVSGAPSLLQLIHALIKGRVPSQKDVDHDL